MIAAWVDAEETRLEVVKDFINALVCYLQHSWMPVMPAMQEACAGLRHAGSILTVLEEMAKVDAVVVVGGNVDAGLAASLRSSLGSLKM